MRNGGAVSDTRDRWRAITLAHIEHFAEFTGDTLNADTDEAAAAANALFGGRVPHGYRLFGGGTVRRPGAGPGARPVSGGGPALLHPG
jgi:acyl dehydratase